MCIEEVAKYKIWASLSNYLSAIAQNVSLSLIYGAAATGGLYFHSLALGIKAALIIFGFQSHTQFETLSISFLTPRPPGLSFVAFSTS